MKNNILKLGSTVFWLNSENKIERVLLKEYKLTLNGGEYLIERLLSDKTQDIFVSENELYENKDQIELINFKDFFVLQPIFESDGLNGRGFPWNKQTFTYFGIYKVLKINEMYLNDLNDYSMRADIIPFGVIKSRELINLNIPITKLKKDSAFILCEDTHLKTIYEFNKNISKLFNKITYNYVNMNTTSCILTGGGGYSFDPNYKKVFSECIKFNKDLEEFIINANLKNDEIFPVLYNFKNLSFDDVEIANDKLYSINKISNGYEIEKIMLVSKSDIVPTEIIKYNGIEDIKVILEKELEAKYYSELIPDLTIYSIKIHTECAFNIINNLVRKNNELVKHNKCLMNIK